MLFNDLLPCVVAPGFFFSALSLLPREIPDHGERWILGMKRSLFVPISAMMTEALSFAAGLVFIIVSPSSVFLLTTVMNALM